MLVDAQSSNFQHVLVLLFFDLFGILCFVIGIQICVLVSYAITLVELYECSMTHARPAVLIAHPYEL